MNIQYWFKGPPMPYWTGGHPFPGTANYAADTLLRVWFDAKSLTLFAMLFAVGLCIQRENVVAKGLRWGPYAFRRLGAMLVFGILHITLLWNGDVLHQYALCALLILPFLKRTRRTLGRWVAGMLVLRVIMLTLRALSVAGSAAPAPGAGIGQTPDPAMLSAWSQKLGEGYTQHSWLAVAHIRLWDWTQFIRLFLPQMVLMLFFTFLVGLWVWSTGVLQDPASHRTTIARVARWGLVLGVAMNVLAAYTTSVVDSLLPHWGWAKLVLPPIAAANVFGAIVLALGIGAALVLLWQDATWQARLRPLTAVGRMGFTSYIMQSFICTFLFYGWGLGWYNTVGPARGIAIGLVIFSVQIALSNWWLRRFRFGPLEWVWRSATYLSAGPFRRA